MHHQDRQTVIFFEKMKSSGQGVPMVSSQKVVFLVGRGASFGGPLFFILNRSLGFGQIARLCHAACFSPSRRRSGLRRGVARSRMRTEADKMPESTISATGNVPASLMTDLGL